MTWSAQLDLTGATVLVGGSGAEALAQVTGLLQAGARVRLLALDPSTSLRDLVARELITEAGELDAELATCALVVPASGDAGADGELAARARAAGRAVAEPVSRPTVPAGPAGRVVLVGGGPGDIGLLTLAGLDAVRTADVVVHDRLAPVAVLDEAPAHAEIIDVGKIPRGRFTPQESINALLVEHAQRGRTVVRLKGGDSFVFGRGGEELQACARAGVPVDVLPGVSSALAAPALAGIPLTHRTLTQGFTVVSGHLAPGAPGATVDWPSLARANTTIVILMGVATLPAITAELVRHGLPADTPAATIADAGLPSQRVVRAPLSEIAAATAAAGLRAPAVSVIGAVAGFDPLA
jgi:uroporphyrin-III C-methyltransferase